MEWLDINQSIRFWVTLTQGQGHKGQKVKSIFVNNSVQKGVAKTKCSLGYSVL